MMKFLAEYGKFDLEWFSINHDETNAHWWCYRAVSSSKIWWEI